MSHSVPNTNPTTNATFESWLQNTNLTGQLLTGNVVTTAANSEGEGTSGNGYINGTLSVDTLVANTALRGGNVTSSGNLTISSNVNLTGNTIVVGNTTINSTVIVAGSFVGNVSITGLNFGNSTVNATGNSVVFEINSPTSTFEVNASVLFIGNGTSNIIANNTTISIGVGTINSSFYTGTANNAEFFGGQNTAYWMAIAGSSNNAVYLGGLPANAYAVLANNNIFTGNNSFTNGTTFSSNVIVNGTETANIIVANTATVANLNATTIVANGNIVANGSVQGLSLLGPHVAIVTNSSVVNTTSQVIIDAFPKAACQCAKYLVFVYNTTTISLIHSIEVMMINDGNTSVIQTQYGELFTGSGLGTFDASINSANVQLLFTAASANSSNTLTVKLVRTQVI